MLLSFVAGFAFHLCQVRVAEAESVTTSYTGALATSQSVSETTLKVTSPADVLLQTFGFAGGTNAQGTVIGPGGTDPFLAVFTGTGSAARAERTAT
jgi:hypothetical protein